MLGGWQLKLILAGLLLAAAAGAAWKINDWRIDAGKLEEAEKAFKDERQGRINDREMFAQQLKYSEAQRKLLNDGLLKIADRFNAIHIPKTLVQTVEVPGACPRVGVGPDFVRVFNDASAP